MCFLFDNRKELGFKHDAGANVVPDASEADVTATKKAYQSVCLFVLLIIIDVVVACMFSLLLAFKCCCSVHSVDFPDVCCHLEDDQDACNCC